MKEKTAVCDKYEGFIRLRIFDMEFKAGKSLQRENVSTKGEIVKQRKKTKDIGIHVQVCDYYRWAVLTIGIQDKLYTESMERDTLAPNPTNAISDCMKGPYPGVRSGKLLWTTRESC